MDFEKTDLQFNQNLSTDLSDNKDHLIKKYMSLDSALESESDSTRSTQSSLIDEAQKTKPDSSIFQNIEDKARGMFDKGLFDGVISILASLHAKSLGTPPTYCLLATAYHQKNLFKQARENYKKALELDPNHVESLVNISILRLDLGDYERGMLSFNRAHSQIQLQEESQWKAYISKQHLNSANAYYDRGYYHESLLEFLKAYVDVEHMMPPSVQLRIIRCLWKLDKKSEAVNKLIALRKAHPTDCDTSLLLGYFYFQANKITAAIHEWERVLKIEPKNKRAIKYLAEIHHIQSVEENSFA